MSPQLRAAPPLHRRHSMVTQGKKDRDALREAAAAASEPRMKYARIGRQVAQAVEEAAAAGKNAAEVANGLCRDEIAEAVADASLAGFAKAAAAAAEAGAAASPVPSGPPAAFGPPT